MAALWLTIVAPVISQTLPTTSAAFDLGAWCTGHGLDTHPNAPTDPAAFTDHCGYCGLLGHSPLAFGHADFLLPPSPLAVQVPIARALPAQIPSRLISAAPRGPPSLG